MAQKQIVGLVSIHAGEPLATGVSASASFAGFTKLQQPYKGGITVTGTAPTQNKFYREGEKEPFFSLVDATSGGTEITWTHSDFDEETKAFYFGESGEDHFEGEKAFVFESNTGSALAFARLKYSAVLSGNVNMETPLQISVTASMLAPTTSGKAWDVIDTPKFTAEPAA